ncbi:dCTP deaminase [Thermoplasmatales archaeon SW_10_69_26]|nr:MAG: dCTP deaminase [Thermoplasmatales archaeon SW_10_69_26]
MQIDEIETVLDGIVHGETQRGDDEYELTVAGIHRLHEPGHIDFGGGETTEPETEPLDTKKRHAEDEYGWWNLEPGTYLLAYNETLDLPDASLVLQPRPALAEMGVSHPTMIVDSLPRVPLAVPPAGARIKENARVSRLVPVTEGRR